MAKVIIELNLIEMAARPLVWRIHVFLTKGGLNTVTWHLATEYAKQGIGFNAVAPGVVDTPLHQENPKDHLSTLQPMGSIAEISDVVDAVLDLANARQVTGEVLYVDGGARRGRWQRRGLAEKREKRV